MEKLEYKIQIAAPVKTVWDSMLQEDTYRQWAGKAWPGSTYEGKWAKGEKIKFTGSDGSGTKAEIVELTPQKSVFTRHIAVLGKGGKEDTTSEVAKGWIGSTEAYKFEERNGKTTVTVTIETTPEWTKMFDDSWPGALDELKKVAEHQTADV
jgi:uncharacterized protein YndB with AHSA1/START domain